jgi:hypothetical protein
MGGIGVAGVWYAYTQYYETLAETPSPTPSPEVSPSPVQEVANDTNTNSNTDVTADSNTTDVNSNRSVATTVTPGPVKPTQDIPPKANPVRTPKPPVTKPTAKPRSGDDRTVILQ